MIWRWLQKFLPPKFHSLTNWSFVKQPIFNYLANSSFVKTSRGLWSRIGGRGAEAFLRAGRAGSLAPSNSSSPPWTKSWTAGNTRWRRGRSPRIWGDEGGGGVWGLEGERVLALELVADAEGGEEEQEPWHLCYPHRAGEEFKSLKLADEFLQALGPASSCLNDKNMNIGTMRGQKYVYILFGSHIIESKHLKGQLWPRVSHVFPFFLPCPPGFSKWFGWHGFSWFLVGFHSFSRWFQGFSWFLVGFHGFSRWFHGFSWFLVGFHSFSRWFHGFSWLLVGFHDFSWWFHGFSWFLVG